MEHDECPCADCQTVKPAPIYIAFADNGHIRKWSHDPFDGGAEYVPVPEGDA